MIETMKMKYLVCVLLLFLLCAGCTAEPSPYEVNNQDNYSLTVRFDANGGVFGGSNTTIITDSFNISGMQVSASGMVELPLCAPDDPARKDCFPVNKNDCFLVGWYTQRTGTEGNYTYSGKWDFATDRLKADPNGSYNADQPVLTLYAAWAPLYEIEVCDLHTGETLETLRYNPMLTEPMLPQWDENTGALNMNGFPERDGYTFNGAYYDAAGTQAISGATVAHTAQLDVETASVSGNAMKLYVDWLEGEWFHIYTAEQFADHASVAGNYVLYADLDFAEERWSTTLTHGNFTGTILGNGHTMRNITFEQTNSNNAKTNAGLFGYLTQSAVLQDVTFENVTFTIKGGSRVAGANFGLLAGTVAAEATLSNVQILSSVLQIDSGCYFSTDDYTIGLVCAMGETAVDASGITCQATGDAPETVVITVIDATVTVTFEAE